MLAGDGTSQGGPLGVFLRLDDGYGDPVCFRVSTRIADASSGGPSVVVDSVASLEADDTVDALGVACRDWVARDDPWLGRGYPEGSVRPLGRGVP